MSLKDSLNAANLNQLSDLLQSVKLGDILRALPTKLYKKAASLPSPLNMIAAVHTVALPNDAKAVKVRRAYARAGTGTLGELVCDTPPMSSATAVGHINVAENGDITLAAADAFTSLDVEYDTEKLDVFTQQFPVASNVIALPAKWTTPGVVRVMRVTLDAGTVTGEGVVIAPSGSVPTSTKQVNLSLLKDIVQFRVADAVTLATVTVGLVPVTDLNAKLTASASPLL